MLITVVTLQMLVSKKRSNLATVGLSHSQPLSFHRAAFFFLLDQLQKENEIYFHSKGKDVQVYEI